MKLSLAITTAVLALSISTLPAQPSSFGGPRGGQGQFGGPQRGGQGQSFGGPQRGGQGFGGPMQRGGQGQGGRGDSGPPNRQSKSNPVDRLMSLDTDGDGKVGRGEIPNSLKSLSQADTDKDGFITRAEATAYVNTFMNNRNRGPAPQGGGAGQRRPDFDR